MSRLCEPERLQADDTPTGAAAAYALVAAFAFITGAVLGGVVVFAAMGGWATFN